MSLVYPMFAMVLLTFVTVIRLFRARVRAVSEGTADPRYFLVYQGDGEPVAAQKLSRHFVNLFEAPVLFYVACLAAMQIGVTGYLIVILAWLYVAARMVHTIIHTGVNRLRPRLTAYFASWFVLLAMWVLLIVALGMRGTVL
jgi:hypothetical protein